MGWRRTSSELVGVCGDKPAQLAVGLAQSLDLPCGEIGPRGMASRWRDFGGVEAIGLLLGLAKKVRGMLRIDLEPCHALRQRGLDPGRIKRALMGEGGVDE